MHDSDWAGKHDKMHWGCCWMPVSAKILWTLSFLALIGGFVALWYGGELFSVSYVTWYLNAITGGVLSIGAKVQSWHYHWHQKNS